MTALHLPNPTPTDPRDDNAAPEVLTEAFLRAGTFLNLSKTQLARIIGVSPATVSRMPARPLNPRGKDGELALLLLRMYRSLVALYGGNVGQAVAWLTHDHDHFGARPVDLIERVEGLVEVCAYLDAMRG